MSRIESTSAGDMVGNVVGATIIGVMLWRAHPELEGELAAALNGAGA